MAAGMVYEQRDLETWETGSEREEALRQGYILTPFFAEQLPIVWLYHTRGVQAMNDRVHDVRMDMRGELPTVAAWRVSP